LPPVAPWGVVFEGGGGGGGFLLLSLEFSMLWWLDDNFSTSVRDYLAALVKSDLSEVVCGIVEGDSTIFVKMNVGQVDDSQVRASVLSEAQGFKFCWDRVTRSTSGFVGSSEHYPATGRNQEDVGCLEIAGNKRRLSRVKYVAGRSDVIIELRQK